MENEKLPPIFNTSDVLMNHLRAKIAYVVPSTDDVNIVINEISKNLTNREIIALLENEELLIHSIRNSKLYSGIRRQTLGEELFYAVSQVDSELCAQLTGMLLELDVSVIQHLISDTDALHKAVLKAKQEYIRYSQGGEERREEIGENLYELVRQKYTEPNLAAKLTGMLLELETEQLSKVLQNSAELSQKLETAYKVLQDSQ